MSVGARCCWRALLTAGRVPNIKKGLVNTSVPQRTNNSLEYNVKLAQIAEEKGFTFALTQIRFMAAGDDSQYEVGVAALKPGSF